MSTVSKATDHPVNRCYGKSQKSLIILQKLRVCMSHPSYEPSTNLASHRKMVALCGYHCAACMSTCEAVHDISWQRHPHIKKQDRWASRCILGRRLEAQKVMTTVEFVASNVMNCFSMNSGRTVNGEAIVMHI